MTYNWQSYYTYTTSVDFAKGGTKKNKHSSSTWPVISFYKFVLQQGVWNGYTFINLIISKNHTVNHYHYFMHKPVSGHHQQLSWKYQLPFQSGLDHKECPLCIGQKLVWLFNFWGIASSLSGVITYWLFIAKNYKTDSPYYHCLNTCKCGKYIQIAHQSERKQDLDKHKEILVHSDVVETNE